MENFDKYQVSVKFAKFPVPVYVVVVVVGGTVAF